MSSESESRPWLKRLLILPPILLGAAVLAILVSGREPPQRAGPAETVHTVRVIAVEPLAFRPRAIGHGSVEPGSVWEAIAEVDGTVVTRHRRLERGAIIEAGTAIVQIDRIDYELALARIDASIDSTEAELAELAVRGSNLQASLAIERRAAELARQDLSRRQALLARDAVSQAVVDEAERSLLTHRQRVQELENELNLIPAQRSVLEANRALSHAEREEAVRDLARTEIILPFDGRIADAPVEQAEYVSRGQVLAVADSIDLAEVTAQVPIDHVAPLVPLDISPTDLSAREMSNLARQFHLDVEVRMAMGERTVRWPARFDRILESVDPETRTLGIVVQVDDPLRLAIPGERPPLTKQMYVEVELRGQARPGTFVVPRVAVHRRGDGGAVVYLAGEEDRLVVRPVATGPVQGDLMVIEEGLAAGDRVVVSDLIPAIDGMALAPQLDTALAAALRAQAVGEAASVDATPEQAHR